MGIGAGEKLSLVVAICELDKIRCLADEQASVVLWSVGLSVCLHFTRGDFYRSAAYSEDF